MQLHFFQWSRDEATILRILNVCPVMTLKYFIKYLRAWVFLKVYLNGHFCNKILRHNQCWSYIIRTTCRFSFTTSGEANPSQQHYKVLSIVLVKHRWWHRSESISCQIQPGAGHLFFVFFNCTEIAFALLTQLPGVRIPALPRYFFRDFSSHYCLVCGQHWEIDPIQCFSKGFWKRS